MEHFGIPMWYVYCALFFVVGFLGFAQSYIFWSEKEKFRLQTEKLQKEIEEIKKQTTELTSQLEKAESEREKTCTETNQPDSLNNEANILEGLKSLNKEGDSIYDYFSDKTAFYKQKHKLFRVKSDRWKKDVSNFLMEHKENLDFTEKDIFEQRTPLLLQVSQAAQQDKSWAYELEIFAFFIENLNTFINLWKQKIGQK